jgi:SAM-dependent methyltransferase
MEVVAEAEDGIEALEKVVAERPDVALLDVATGTGLMARSAARILGDARSVVGLDPSAGMLAEARRRVPVTLVQGIAQGVGGHTLAQLVDHACAVVPHRSSLRRYRVVLRVAPPSMQVRPTDARLGHPQQDILRPRVGNVILLDLEGLPIFSDNYLSSFHSVT